MFTGRHSHTIDKKGRVSIPSKFREVLLAKYDNTLVITSYIKCLYAYPSAEWKKLSKKFEQLKQFEKPNQDFLRFFVSPAETCSIDKQGRILIPPTLRDSAGLERKVTFVGVTNRIEIWNSKTWEEEFKRLRMSAERGEFDGLGI